MKVAVVTLMDDANLGNRLQNYAVQQILCQRGYDVTSIYTTTKTSSMFSRHGIKEWLHAVLLRTGLRSSHFYIKHLGKGKRELLGNGFTRKYIKTSKRYVLRYMNHKMEKYQDDFDFWCVGSDQVWNGNLVQTNPEWFLTFAPSNRVFSFSASFGNTNIASAYIDNFTAGFKHMENISVREKDGQNLVRKLAGKEADLLLDPTLLLGQGGWLEIEAKPKPLGDKPYILTYFLGGMTSTQRNHIEKYASKQGLEMIEVQNNRDQIGPCEFVWLIHHAEFIFTDSFHGCAFSTIFAKQFLAFNRNGGFDMSGRITTLLDTFGLNVSYVRTIDEEYTDFIRRIDTIAHADRSCIDSVMTKEREKLGNYLGRVFR